MKDVPLATWILIAALVVGIVVVTRGKNNQAKPDPYGLNQFQSGRPEDRVANWAGPPDLRAFDQVTNG